jgi:uncharacterized protein
MNRKIFNMTQRYIDIAQRGKNDWWRYVLGLFIPLLTAFVPLLIGSIAASIYNVIYLDIPNREIWNYIPITMLYSFLIAIAVGFILGLRFVIQRLHQRPFLSLVSPDATFQFERLLKAMMLWILLLGGQGLYSYSQNPQNWTFKFSFERWMTAFPVVGMFSVVTGSIMAICCFAYPVQGLSRLLRKPLPLALAISTIILAMLSPLLFSRFASSPLGAIVDFFILFFSLLFFLLIMFKDHRLELLSGIFSADIFYSSVIVNMINNDDKSIFDSSPSIWQVDRIPNLFNANPVLYMTRTGLYFLCMAIFYYAFLGRRDRQKIS